MSVNTRTPSDISKSPSKGQLKPILRSAPIKSSNRTVQDVLKTFDLSVTDYQNRQPLNKSINQTDSLLQLSKASLLNSSQGMRNAMIPFKLKQFKNGFYYGQESSKAELEGEGAFYWNEGDFYYGQWKQSQFEGVGIFIFSFGGYVEGQFSMGRLDGLSKVTLLNGMQYIGYWKQGIQHGQAVFQNVEGVQSFYTFVNGQQLNKEQARKNFIFTAKEMGDQEEKVRGIRAQYFANLLASNLLYAQEQDGMRMFSPCLVNPQTNAEGLAMSLNIELRCDYGFYRDAQLDGKGRISFRSGDIYDGYFNQGKFKGIGIYYNHSENKNTYGKYDGIEIIQVVQQMVEFPPISLASIQSEIIVSAKNISTEYAGSQLVQFVLDQKRFQTNLQEISKTDIFLHQTADSRKNKSSTKSTARNMTPKLNEEGNPNSAKEKHTVERQKTGFGPSGSTGQQQRMFQGASPQKINLDQLVKPSNESSKLVLNKGSRTPQHFTPGSYKKESLPQIYTKLKDKEKSPRQLMPFQPNEKIHLPFSKLDRFSAHFPFGASPIKHHIQFGDYPQKNPYYQQFENHKTYLQLHGKSPLSVDSKTKMKLMMELEDNYSQMERSWEHLDEGVAPLPRNTLSTHKKQIYDPVD